jgi:TolB-like protein
MHFLDYFPHREMGIALYHLKKYPEAIKELGTSLSQEESAKAKYFLNKARKSMLVSQGRVKLPPRIQITSPQEGEYTNLFSVEVTGVAEDDQFVSQIEINGTSLFIELSQKTMEFKQTVDLHDGINLIRVKAKDLTGEETEKVIRVIVDRQGPLFSIEDVNVERRKEGIIGIRCSLADEVGLSSLNLQDKKFEFEGRKEIEINEKVILKTGEERIPFEVKDLAGNTTAGEINLSSPPAQSLNSIIQVVFLDERIRDLGTGLFSKDKGVPPVVIHLKDLTERQTVHYETILIDGDVSGPYEIKSIVINGTPLFVKPVKNLFFNHLAQLREGENRFEIKVTDKEGNTAMKNITVIQETPRVKRVNSRMSILLLPFETKGQAPSAGDIVFDALTSAFVNQSRFNVVSREKMEEVLRELKLSKTDLVDLSNALKGGRIIAAEGIITGSINETPNSIEIFARLINTETTSVLAAKDVFSQDKSISQIQFLSEGLALKFKHSFPLVEGQVVKVNGKEIYTDFGLNKNIKKEMKFIVYREGEKICHPVTGKILGCEFTDLGEGRVEEVFDNYSKGKLLTKGSVREVRRHDKVITK